MSSRYMTPLGKAQALESWEAAKATRAAAPPTGFTGGRGWPDPEIYGWCDKLNALHRVCTLQSCAGHRCTKEDSCEYCVDTAAFYKSDSAEHVWNGQLWLWLDEKMARYVYENAHHVAALPGIEKFGALWHVEGQEIFDIQFRGAGHGELDKSMAAIVLFFEEASWRCNLS